MKTKAEDLFQFEWPVDQHGYELADEPPGDGRFVLTTYDGFRVIRRRKGPLKYYRPLEKDPAFTRNFAALTINEPAVLKFVDQYGLLGDQDQEPLEQIYNNIRFFHRLYRLIEGGKRDAARDVFNERARPLMTIKIGGYGQTKMGLEIVPTSLISCMHLQVAKDIVGVVKYGQCEECAKWFPYRSSKRFCGERCRKAWHRHNMEVAHD